MRHAPAAIGLLVGVVLAGWSGVGRADVVISVNDGHTVLDEQGNLVAPPTIRPDSLTVLDVGRYPPTVTATVEVPGSVVGPPMSVWVAPDESWAIATSATKADAAVKFGIGPDDRVSVIDLTAKPPKIVQSTTAGAGATTVRVSPDGKMALIANRTEGSVSIYGVAGKRLEPAGKLDLGAKSGPSGIVFLPDSKTALVARNFDHQVSVLHIDGTKVEVDKRPITTGMSPYTMDVNAAGTLAAVSNMGRGDGDVDSVSLIDLSVTPPRTVETVAVPSGPEPLKFSPDGAFLAVGSQEGSSGNPASPFFHEHGRLTMFAVRDKHLTKVAEAPIGPWAEGVAFSRDGRTVLMQDMKNRKILVFRWESGQLTPGTSITLTEGPEAFGTAW